MHKYLHQIMPEYQIGIIDQQDLSIGKMSELFKSAGLEVVEVKRTNDIKRIKELKGLGKVRLHLQYDQNGDFFNPVSPDFEETLQSGWLDSVIEAVRDSSSDGLDYLTIHFGWSRFPFKVTHDFYSVPCKKCTSYGLEQMLNNIKKNADAIKRRYNVKVFPENLEYYNTGTHDYIAIPANICSAVESLDGKFLLDLAHAYIAAQNLSKTKGLPIYKNAIDYTIRLPLDEVVEIHISGSRKRKEGIYVDAHGPLLRSNCKELNLLKVAHPHIKAVTVPLILEQTGSIESLKKQISYIRRVVNSLN